MHKNHILQNLYTKIQILCNRVRISFNVLQPHTSKVQFTIITYTKIPHPCMPQGLKVVPTIKEGNNEKPSNFAQIQFYILKFNNIR